MSAQIKYSEAIKAFKEAAEVAASLAKDAISERSREIFSKYPKLAAFRWSQYTPYFNDGDECVFGINPPDVSIEGSPGKWPDGGFSDSYGFDKGSPEAACADEVEAALNQIAEEDMKSVFGDHVQITATREGFDVEEYGHD